jgi:orotate phosphoribosyltransferase
MILKDEHALRVLTRTNAVVEGHFVCQGSGRHSATYVKKDAVYLYPLDLLWLCEGLANAFIKPFQSGLRIDAVIGPAIGGAIISQWVAYHLSQSTGRDVIAAYAEKDEEKFVIKGEYNMLMAGKNVLIVGITPGGSVRKVIQAVRAIECHVVGLGTLCNSGGVTAEDAGGVPKLVSLLNIEMWDERNCPLCKEAVPINKEFGMGMEFLARKSS